MATEQKQLPVSNDTHNAMIVHALADRDWHSLAELRRVLPDAAINSRVSELRTKHGLTIEKRVVRGKPTRAQAVQYRLLNPPRQMPKIETFMLSPNRTILDPDSVPRDMEHRHRIYRVVRGKRELVATAATPDAAGQLIYDLGLSEEFAGSSFGWLDTYGLPKGNGKWVIQPWDTKPEPKKKAAAA